jgi:hypothetical protein
MLGTLDIDESSLLEDLDRSSRFDFGEPYIEFNCGHPWKSCMLWTTGGDVGDGVIGNYDTTKPALPTVYGEQLPCIRQMVEQFFNIERLLFGRLVVMSNNVLIPHRDYMEFTGRPAEQRAAHRLHIPLATSEDCLFMEDNTIYRMRFGEVWSLDVTRTHSAAVLSDIRRVHLALDFADVDDRTTLLKFDIDDSVSIPKRSIVQRPAMSEREREAVLGLSGVIDLDNFWEILGIVTKKQFRKEGGKNYVWDTMKKIGILSHDSEIQSRIDKLYRHCVLDRSE